MSGRILVRFSGLISIRMLGVGMNVGMVMWLPNDNTSLETAETKTLVEG
jgi:hypothetical protein